jgi:hypothetical protein
LGAVCPFARDRTAAERTEGALKPGDRPIRPRRRASAAKKKKARRAWHTPGQFMEETIPILGDQDSEIYARRMPREGADLKHAPNGN